MQVPPVPPPVVASPLPQDIAAKAVPHAQAAAPLVQNSVQPTAKPEKFNAVNRDKKQKNEKERKSDSADESDGQGEHSVNIRI